MFLLLIILGIYAALLLPGLRKLAPGRTDRLALSIAIPFTIAGCSHFLNPERFIAMIPEVFPEPRLLVYLTGAFEILGAIGLVIGRTRRLAAMGLVALLVALFPANVHVALSGATVEGLPEARWYYWARLPVQLVFIAWLVGAGELMRRNRSRS